MSYIFLIIGKVYRYQLAKVFGPLYIDFNIVPAFFYLFPHGKI